MIYQSWLMSIDTCLSTGFFKNAEYTAGFRKRREKVKETGRGRQLRVKGERQLSEKRKEIIKGKEF